MNFKKIFGLNLAAGCAVTSCFGILFMIFLGFAVDQLPFGLSELGWAWMQGELDAVDTHNVNIVIASSYSSANCVPGGLPGGGAWRITQYFHDPNWNPNHNGVDFGIPIGTPLYGTIGGEVTYAGWNDQGYGNLVIVQNGAVSTYFAHLDTVIVKPGQILTPNCLLGLSGTTGRSTGPHLHYEVRVNGVPVDPLSGVFGDIVCGCESADQTDPAMVGVPGTGGAFDTPPVRLERDPATVDFRVVSAYGRYDPEPGVIYGQVMDAAGDPLSGAVVEVFWSNDEGEGVAQTVTGPDGMFLFQIYDLTVSVRIANATSQVVTDLMTDEGSYDIFFKQTVPAPDEEGG